MVRPPTAMPSIWWPRQMPKVGSPASINARITGTAYSPVAAGSPGPLDRNTPSGLRSKMSCAGVVAGTTVTTPAQDIFDLKPDGVFLSNGPGDPAATGEYAVPVIRALIDAGLPTFGICLGHQMLGIAVGGRTMKMHQGHHGANHPVKDLVTGKVEITSMNHGFAVDRASLPD